MQAPVSRIDSDVKRHPDLRIPVGDETVAATRYEPVAYEEPLPALLMYVPYHKDDLITYGGYDPINTYLAKHGYEVVIADMVGTGASTGHIEEPFTRREGKEPAAIVDWLADQPWTTGDVGMYGKSYGGITALDAAAQQPDALEAIVPIHTPYLGYRNAYNYGGAFELLTIGMDWLTLMQALDAKPPSRRESGGEWAEIWRSRLDDISDRTPWLIQFLDNELKEGYWDDKDIPVSKIQTPTLAVTGWRDPYTKDSVEYFQQIDATKRLLMGPWRHEMPHRGRESAIDFRRQVRDWFDHFLKGEDTDVLDWPTYRYWTETDGGGNVDGGTWRGGTRWPVAADDASETVSYRLTPTGLRPASEEMTGSVERDLEFDHTIGLSAMDPYGAKVPPMDTNADDARSLTFETDPLSEHLELTGTATARLRVASTSSDPLVTARLVDVAPDHSATMITAETVRGRARNGLGDPEPVEPGTVYEYEIALDPKSHVFEAGHRLRLAIHTGLFPENGPTPEHGTLTLYSEPDAPSTITLPGRFRTDLDFEDAIEMAPPETDVPVTSPYVVDSESAWETTRDHVNGRASARKSSQSVIEADHVDVRRRAEFTAAVDVDEPSGFVSENTVELTMEYDNETIEVAASNRFTHDICEISTEVAIDDRTVFDEQWIR